MKKANIGLVVSLFGILSVVWMIGPVSAAWTPGSDEIGPIKDTYISAGGVLASPTSNYGGGETLYAGDCLDGDCVTAIAFDLSGLPDEVETLNFQSDIVVYGDATRIVRVFVFINLAWEEMQVTNASNPFDAANLLNVTKSSANCTSVTITGSTKALNFSVVNWKSASTLTLVFVGDPANEADWITMSARENSYLSSYSEPPRLTFTEPTPEVDLGDLPGAPIGLVVLVSLVAVTAIGLRSKLKRA